MEFEEYFKRIELDSSVQAPTKDYLNQLHISHLTHIPFETFDLIDLKELNISIESIFDRIVRQKRGGICYQMNGLFGFILKKLGYNVQFIACEAYVSEKDFYHDQYSHASLCITLENGEQMLCDVGYINDYLTPLYFRTDCVQFAVNGFFRLTKSDDEQFYLLERGFLKNKDDSFLLKPSSSPQTSIVDIDPEKIQWIISYRFAVNFQDLEIQLKDYEQTCPYIIHSPDIILNHCTICRMQVYGPFIGSCGIIGKKYCEWKFEDGIETHTSIPISNEDLKAILKEKFNLDINRDLQLVSPK